MPPGTSHDIKILASGTQPGVLNPGEHVQVPVYYLGLLLPWDFNDNKIELELRQWTVDDTSVIDWAAQKEALRPPTLDTTTWDVIYANLTSDLHTTGDYVRMLSDNAKYLGRLGERMVDVDDLWNFEIQQAYGFPAVPTLDSTVDASVPAQGVPLQLSRWFSSSVQARNSVGLFGYGWYTPWQARLLVLNSGSLVEVVGEAGSARVFAQDTRPRVATSPAPATAAP